MSIYAYVNTSALPILAADNSSTDAFLDLLKTGDVTIDMHDYGSFEKVGPLGTILPRNDETGFGIHTTRIKNI